MAAKKRASKKASTKRVSPNAKLGTPPIFKMKRQRKQFGAQPGRPTMRSPIMEEEILTRLSCGESLASIGQDDHMPNIGTVLRWCQEDSSFKERYDLARESQASAYFEQLVVISDGRTRMADPQRDRLRVDARKWVLSRMDRSKYGDRSDINLGGQPGAPIETKAVNEDSLTPEEQKTLRELGRKLATGGSK